MEQAQQGGPQAEQSGAGTRSGSTTGQAAPSARRWEAEVVQVAGVELGAQIIAAEAWYHLQNRLDKYKAAGEDPLQHLSEALAEGGLATANDKSRVLISRINHPGHYRDRPGRPPGSTPGRPTLSTSRSVDEPTENAVKPASNPVPKAETNPAAFASDTAPTGRHL